ERKVSGFFKMAEKVENFISEKENFKGLDGSREVIAHTRFGTCGLKVDRNAHPFMVGKYIGTHNGWLLNYEKIAKEHDITGFEVDSEVIYMLLNKYDDYNILKELEGAMALAFIKDKKLHLYRRENKPLFVGKIG